jgi:flagellar hook protein FlgE
MYSESPGSGPVIVGSAGNQGMGLIRPNTLELSNVDLATEFVNMITAQRGFQANSKVVTTSDEVLAELVNLKR